MRNKVSIVKYAHLVVRKGITGDQLLEEYPSGSAILRDQLFGMQCSEKRRQCLQMVACIG